MCLGIPAQLIKVEGNSGWVNIAGCRHEVRLDLVDAAQVGEYVIVHAGFAIHKLDEQQAKDSLKLLQGYLR